MRHAKHATHLAIVLGLLLGCGSADQEGPGDRNEVIGPAGRLGAGTSGGAFDNVNPQAGSSSAAPSVPVNPGAAGGVCEIVSLSAEPTTPDMLIVLDRSGS